MFSLCLDWNAAMRVTPDGHAWTWHDFLDYQRDWDDFDPSWTWERSKDATVLKRHYYLRRVLRRSTVKLLKRKLRVGLSLSLGTHMHAKIFSYLEVRRSF